MGRYDLTDFEWSIIQPLLPNKPRGVPRVDDRRVLNGIFWVIAIGDNVIEEVLRGFEPTAFYLNEMDLLAEEVLVYCRGRVGRYPRMDEGGPSWYGILFDLNAPEEDNWTVDKLRDNLDPTAIAFFRQPGGMLDLGGGEYVVNPKAENLTEFPSLRSWHIGETY